MPWNDLKTMRVIAEMVFESPTQLQYIINGPFGPYLYINDHEELRKPKAIGSRISIRIEDENSPETVRINCITCYKF